MSKDPYSSTDKIASTTDTSSYMLSWTKLLHLGLIKNIFYTSLCFIFKIMMLVMKKVFYFQFLSLDQKYLSFYLYMTFVKLQVLLRSLKVFKKLVFYFFKWWFLDVTLLQYMDKSTFVLLSSCNFLEHRLPDTLAWFWKLLSTKLSNKEFLYVYCTSHTEADFHSL